MLAIVSNGIFTNTRLLHLGYDIDAGCPACGEALDTIYHRCFACPKVSGRARLTLGDDFFNIIMEKGADSVLANQLVCPVPLPSQPPLDNVKRVFVGGMSAGDVFLAQDGALLGDGSCSDPSASWLARAGFSVVQVNDVGEVVKGFFCNVPSCLPQTSLCAEYLAFASAAMFADFGCVYAGDCQDVLSGFGAGVKRAVRSKSQHACVWKGLFNQCNDFDKRIVDVVKVKAHQCESDVGPDDRELFLFRGNEQADLLAKQGAGLHPVGSEERTLYKNASSRLLTLARHMVDELATIHATRLEQMGVCRRLLAGTHLPSLHTGSGATHAFVWRSNRWICSICLVRTTNANRLSGPAGRCKGPPPFKGLLRNPSKGGHQLWASATSEGDAFVYCSKCFHYACPHPRKLCKPCVPLLPHVYSSERYYISKRLRPVSQLRLLLPVAVHDLK